MNTIISVLAPSVDFNALVSLYQVSKATQTILNGKEVLMLLDSRYKLNPSKCFHDFVLEYPKHYPCTRSFIYHKPAVVAVMAAKALNFDMIMESCQRGANNHYYMIKYAVKASIKKDKNIVHNTVIRMFDMHRNAHYVKFAYYYGSRVIGDYFMKFLDSDEDYEDIMYDAIHGGLIDYVKENIDEQISVGEACEYLSPACNGKHRNMIDYIISKGATFEMLDEQFCDAMCCAIKSGFLDLVIKAHEMKKRKDNITVEKYNIHIAYADRKGYTEISNYLKSCM